MQLMFKDIHKVRDRSPYDKAAVLGKLSEAGVGIIDRLTPVATHIERVTLSLGPYIFQEVLYPGYEIRFSTVSPGKDKPATIVSDVPVSRGPDQAFRFRASDGFPVDAFVNFVVDGALRQLKILLSDHQAVVGQLQGAIVDIERLQHQSTAA